MKNTVINWNRAACDAYERFDEVNKYKPVYPAELSRQVVSYLCDLGSVNKLKLKEKFGNLIPKNKKFDDFIITVFASVTTAVHGGPLPEDDPWYTSLGNGGVRTYKVDNRFASAWKECAIRKGLSS